ncbi:MAG: metal-sensitive transcriptional regulator [Christensenellales bacterium]
MTDELKKQMDTRLACIEGHIGAIRRMLKEDGGCEEILTQVSANISALEKVGKIILKNHLEHCVRDGVERGDFEVFDNFSKVLDKFL